MVVDYNTYAKTFAQSRKNMRWEEIKYFFSLWCELDEILDIWCWSWRLLESYNEYFSKKPDVYLGVDLSNWLLEEAQKAHPESDFKVWNMLDIVKIVQERKFKNIFLIASFHHLVSQEQREECLNNIYNISQEWSKVYMTNWALNSPFNKTKYNQSKIVDSKNGYWAYDYEIKIWKSKRFYHCFTLWELKELSENAGFKVIENRLFDSEKNFITILEK